jgi:hypothetical protein
VGVVPLFGLVFGVVKGDRNTALALFGSVVDIFNLLNTGFISRALLPNMGITWE